MFRCRPISAALCAAAPSAVAAASKRWCAASSDAKAPKKPDEEDAPAPSAAAAAAAGAADEAAAAPSAASDSADVTTPAGTGAAGSSDELTAIDEMDAKYRRVTSREFDDTLVEKYSKAALQADGRENRIEAEDFNEDTSYVPVLAKWAHRKKNVYEYTDDIPKDVPPLYSHQVYQQREYIRGQRERAERPLWKSLMRYGTIGCFWVVLGGAVEFTRIWLQQPAEIARLRLQLLEQSYGKVLELGAGHGLNIGSYPYPVHEIVMVDQSQQLLDKLHYRVPKTAYPKYSTCQDRAERLDNFKDAEFDCVIDMFGLCHYRDPVMALRQMQRVVKPTGTILLLEHGRSPYFPVNWVLDYFSDRHTAHTHGCLWNLPLKDYFKEARLEMRELKQQHYGTTYYAIAHPEILDQKAMEFVPKRDELFVR